MSLDRGAAAAILSVVVLWSFPPPIAKYLTSFGIDQWSQNFWRYVAATLGLVLLALFRKEGFGTSGRQRLLFLLPAVFNMMQQALWVAALYAPEFYPGQTALLQKTMVVFGAALAYLVFPEERPRIRSPHYLAGVATAMIGAVGIVVFSPDFESRGYLMGAFLTVTAMAAWAGYSVTMKKVIHDTDPVAGFTWVSLYTTILFGVFALVWGKPSSAVNAPAVPVAVMILSGLACISLAHPLFFHAARRLGVAVCTAVLLLTTVTIPAISVAFLGERFTPLQIAFGAVLVFGSWLTIQRQDRPLPWQKAIRSR